MAVFGMPGGAELAIIAIVVLIIGSPTLLVGLVVWMTLGRKSKDAGPLAPAGWFADPTGRHEYRFWDGGAWTAYVSDAGVQTDDPV